MIELIDQSDPTKLKFRCSNCLREFTQPNYGMLDLHTPNLTDPKILRLGIPPCQPLPEKPKARDK